MTGNTGNMMRCLECGHGSLQRRVYEHVTTLGGIRVHDSTERALVCSITACGASVLDARQLAGYERRAAAEVLARGKNVTGPVLRFARKALGLKQTELGAQLDVSSETLSRWENGEPKVPREIQLAVAYLLTATERDEMSFMDFLSPSPFDDIQIHRAERK